MFWGYLVDIIYTSFHTVASIGFNFESYFSQLTFNEWTSPSLSLKRVLAKEVGLTLHQVNMWMSVQR